MKTTTTTTATTTTTYQQLKQLEIDKCKKSNEI